MFCYAQSKRTSPLTLADPGEGLLGLTHGDAGGHHGGVAHAHGLRRHWVGRAQPQLVPHARLSL